MTITLTLVMVFMSASVETREAVTPRNDGIPVEEKRPSCGFDYVGSP